MIVDSTDSSINIKDCKLVEDDEIFSDNDDEEFYNEVKKSVKD